MRWGEASMVHGDSHVICGHCFMSVEVEEQLHEHAWPSLEWCCFCGRPTSAGIRIRAASSVTPFCTVGPADDV